MKRMKVMKLNHNLLSVVQFSNMTKKKVTRLMPVPWIRVYFVRLLFKLSTKKV